MRLEDFDYQLPEHAIAQAPLSERDAARLLVHDLQRGATSHRRVRDLVELLDPGDLLVVNDTRVLAARHFARRPSHRDGGGGRVELLLLESLGGEPPRWRALVRPAGALRPGERLASERGGFDWVALERERDAHGQGGPEWIVGFDGSERGSALDALLEATGELPLPPYVRRADGPDERDRERYQTVYASAPGAVAAPTAGLHFTPELLAALERRGVERTAVTLHVGPGTFRPVSAADPREHHMHAERYEVPAAAADAYARARALGRRVVAVGTTVVRTLETAVDRDGNLAPAKGATDLYLLPGHQFRAVDGLLTNFHLPRSTLLMLVSAFAGRERVLGLYAEALERGYRFYSFGDAMLLLRARAH